jgi:iron(III) transport system substrate-binding protein
MPVSRWTRRRVALVAGAVLIVILALAVAAMALGGGADIVVYNGRSQYGDEPSFKAFEDETGLKVELRGGTAPELYERLRREGDATEADLLVTTDLANLWRAKDAGLLEPVTTNALQDHTDLRDPDDAWWGLSTRVRTPMRSTERVPEDAVTSYADLGDPRWKGKVCLRTSNNEYNQSFVADQIVKQGAEQTEELLRSWMANDPQILGSDVDVLKAIAAGDCDVGLTNHYYLARELKDDPDFPVAPAWPEAGPHANLSGVGLVKGAEHRENAIRLMEFLTDARAQQVVADNGEFPANSDVRPSGPSESWVDEAGTLDVIDLEQAGPALPQAVEMMQSVGWE